MKSAKYLLQSVRLRHLKTKWHFAVCKKNLCRFVFITGIFLAKNPTTHTRDYFFRLSTESLQKKSLAFCVRYRNFSYEKSYHSHKRLFFSTFYRKSAKKILIPFRNVVKRIYSVRIDMHKIFFSKTDCI